MNDFNPYPSDARGFIAKNETVLVDGKPCKVLELENGMPFVFSKTLILCENSSGRQFVTQSDSVTPIGFSYVLVPFSLTYRVHDLIRRTAAAMKVSQRSVARNAMLAFFDVCLARYDKEYVSDVSFKVPFTVAPASTSLDYGKSMNIWIEEPLFAVFGKIVTRLELDADRFFNAIMAFTLDPRVNDRSTEFYEMGHSAADLCRRLMSFDVDAFVATLDARMSSEKKGTALDRPFAWVYPGAEVKSAEIDFLPENAEDIQEEKNRKYIVEGTLDGGPIVDETTIVKLRSSSGIKTKHSMVGQLSSYREKTCSECGKPHPLNEYAMIHHSGYFMDLCNECLAKYYSPSRIGTVRVIANKFIDTMVVGKPYTVNELKNMLKIKNVSSYIGTGLSTGLLNDNGEKGDKREIWLEAPEFGVPNDDKVKVLNVNDCLKDVYSGVIDSPKKVRFSGPTGDELYNRAKRHNIKIDDTSSGTGMMQQYSSDVMGDDACRPEIKGSTVPDSAAPAAPDIMRNDDEEEDDVFGIGRENTEVEDTAAHDAVKMLIKSECVDTGDEDKNQDTGEIPRIDATDAGDAETEVREDDADIVKNDDATVDDYKELIKDSIIQLYPIYNDMKRIADEMEVYRTSNKQKLTLNEPVEVSNGAAVDVGIRIEKQQPEPLQGPTSLETATVDELLEELKRRGVIKPGTKLKFKETKVETVTVEKVIKRKFKF